MNFEQSHQEICDDLTQRINTFLPNHPFSEVIKYSVFPPGKLFRPMLVHSLAQDLGQINEDHKWFSMAIELHHTYTLIHDDLPSMDNDDYRRGRLSSHKKFSEWQAILAGDGLLNLSYELLGNIENGEHLKDVLCTFAKATGPKGLILGQVKDLGNENNNFERLLEIHRLKTGELIQLSLSGTAILSNRPELKNDMYSLGMALGENFQLLDDLCELTEEIGSHEKEINPFLCFNKEICLNKIKSNSLLIKSELKKHHLNNLEAYINLYLNKTKAKISGGIDSINKHIDLELDSLSFL